MGFKGFESTLVSILLLAPFLPLLALSFSIIGYKFAFQAPSTAHVTNNFHHSGHLAIHVYPSLFHASLHSCCHEPSSINCRMAEARVRAC